MGDRYDQLAYDLGEVQDIADDETCPCCGKLGDVCECNELEIKLARRADAEDRRAGA